MDADGFGNVINILPTSGFAALDPYVCARGFQIGESLSKMATSLARRLAFAELGTKRMNVQVCYAAA